MSQLPPATIAAIDSQVTAVADYLGRRFPNFADDVRQECWAQALLTAPRFDPDSPGAKGYFYWGVAGAVSAKINQWISVTKISRIEARRAARGGQGPEHQVRVPLDEVDVAAARDGAEDAEELRLALARLARLRVRYRRAVDRATSNLTKQEQEVGALLHGLDGPPRGVAWVVRHTGLWRDEVEAAGRAYRKAMRRRREVMSLEAQINETEEALP